MNLQIIDKYITEVLHATDPVEKKAIEKRIVDAIRTARAAEAAAEIAKKNGNEELAQKLLERAAELKELAAHAYEDIIDAEDDTTQDTSSGGDDSEDSGENDASEEDNTESDSKDDKSEDSEESENDNTEDSDQADTNSEQENPFDNSSDEGGKQNSSNSDKDNSSNSDSSSDSGSEDNQNDGDESDKGEEEEEEEPDSEGNGSEDDEETDESDGDSSDTDGDSDSGSDTDSESDSDSDSEANSDSSKESSSEADDGSDNSDEDDSDEEEETDDDAPVKDPFADEEDIPSMPAMGQQGQEPRDATLEDIIKELKGLSGEGRRGAIQALKDIQVNRGSGEKKESLSESLLTEAKNIRELTDDEYAELINSTLDMIDQAGEELTYSDNITRKAKVKEINNPTTRRELTKEISDDAVKAHQEVKAREQELNKYKNCKTIEEFELNFYNTINTEVNWIKQKKKSWNEINNDYEDEDILVKADVVKKHLEEVIPVIDFYFDVSGSWTGYPDAVTIGQRAVATVKEFADDGLVKLNVCYFGRNGLSSNMYAVWGGGTSCWEQIIANIKKTGATNVVLMTDGDMENQAKWGSGVKVDGCVWFIWGLGGNSTGPGYTEQGHEIPKKLIGQGNNTHYAFDVKGHK